MAGLSGNQAWLAYQKQTAKGTVATIPAYVATKTTNFKTPFSGGSIGPIREIEELAETDATRNQGVSYVKSSGVKGNPQVYVRDNNIGAPLFYCFGADAVTGATNFTHTITPNETIPYVTFWQNLGGSSGLYEQYKDCFVSDLEFKASAGGPLTCDMNILGLEAERLTADPTATPKTPLESGYVYNYNDCNVVLGSATALVSSMTISVSNNVSLQQTDNVLPYDLAVGKFAVTASFDMIFANIEEYKKFQYTSASTYTKISNSIYTNNLSFVYEHGANNSVEFVMPTVAYEEFPLAPDVSGAPIVSTIKCVAQRPVSGSIITAIVKNQQETY